MDRLAPDHDAIVAGQHVPAGPITRPRRGKHSSRAARRGCKHLWLSGQVFDDQAAMSSLRAELANGAQREHPGALQAFTLGGGELKILRDVVDIAGIQLWDTLVPLPLVHERAINPKA